MTTCRRRSAVIPLLFWLLSIPAAGNCGADAAEIVRASIDYYRGQASASTVEMTIHRRAWERTLTIRGWTKGMKESLFAITAPPKDEGNATLKRGNEMWTFNPKVHRTIKIPPSMMSQSWMGSDFSNNDLAKSDSILEDYTHRLAGAESHQGKTVFVIESLPRPAAPVVWGKQLLRIREDHILLAEEFYDEDLRLVKSLTGSRIEMMGGRLFPTVWRMEKADAAGEYTQLRYLELSFPEDLPDSLFTLSSLKTLRR
ncbi:MAG: outer membrane lipoprotein-sorting protein [Deltaproteobacteria bacterium]|nr:outer membrane lipoprotein-sorting protein [Deltaproteobacteria bacterium]